MIDSAMADEERRAIVVDSLRVAYAESPDAAFVFDPNGCFLMVNAALCRFLRVSEADLIGRPYDTAARSTDGRRVQESVATALSGTTTRYRTSGTRTTSEPFVSEVTLTPIRLNGRVVAVLGTALDLTAVDAAETEARRGADLLRLAGRIARFGGWSVDATSRDVTLSEGARTVLGISDDVADLSAVAWSLHPDDERDRVRDLLEQCLTEGHSFDIESVMMTTRGERLIVRTIGEPQRRHDGVIVGAHGAILDVTAKEEAAVATRHDQERLTFQAALLDTARDAMYVHELGGSLVYWNRAAAELYGWSAEEALGRNVSDIVDIDADAQTAALDALMRTGYFSDELEQHTRDGRTIIVECHWQLVDGGVGSGPSVFAVNTDITEWRRAEEARQRAQRLESLGTLAGGIAHDLNNVLTPILMSVQLLAHDENDPDRRELLHAAETAAKRGAEMIRQVLTFARGIDGHRVRVEADSLLKDLLALTKDLLPRSIEVTTHRDADTPATLGDPTQLLQVLVNLVTNARDAMPTNGRLTITASTLELADEFASVSHVASPGTYLQFTVEDTGHGMRDDVVAKIFEPFFTTKTHGHGTGLGLPTSLAIIRSHGGFLQVESEPDRGTRFTVALPAIDHEADAALEEAGPTAPLPRGAGEVVLVVDDEEAIRVVTGRSLEAHGYRVLLAAHGREAIDLIENGDIPVDIVVTDMMMPVMDGAMTSAYLEEHHPDIPIIATSGLNEGGESSVAGMGISQFIAKPYSAMTLLTGVSDTLREAREHRKESS